MASVMEARRRILLNTPHIKTASGGVANFKTDMIAPLKGCKINFLPKQSGSGDPSPTNVRPISGWDGVNVTRCGKNLLNTDYSAWSLRGSAYAYINDVVPKGQTARFTLIDKDTTADISGCYIGFVFEDLQNALPTSYSWIIDNGVVKRYSNATVNGTPGLLCQNVMIYPQTEQTLQRLLARFYIMVELGSTATTPYEPYTASTFPISWTQQGTVYGGYVDLVSGELWKTYEIVDLGTKNWTEDSQTDAPGLFRCGGSNFLSIKYLGENYCSNYKSVQERAWRSVDYGEISVTNSEEVPIVRVRDDRFVGKTESEVKTMLSGVKYAYEKKQAVLVGVLAPTQIKTLKGINNIYSDADSAEVKFWTH